MMNKIIYSLLVLMTPVWVMAQNDQETIKKSFEVKDKSQETWLSVCNIEGDVEVEAYDGNTIEIEVSKRIRARRDDDVAQGMKDVQIDFFEGEGYVAARFTTPNNRYKEKQDPLACSWDWDRNANKVYYKYRLDYKVKVPREISVKISTVNNSDLYIKGVEGMVYANNVNGDVELTDIGNDTRAKTVNGRIDVKYAKMPTEFADFETVNGNIEVTAPKDGGAIYNFESQWGKIYSDFDFDKRLSPKVVSNKSGKGGTTYKVAKSNSYQVNEGGPEISFKTLNGKIMLRKGN